MHKMGEGNKKKTILLHALPQEGNGFLVQQPFYSHVHPLSQRTNHADRHIFYSPSADVCSSVLISTAVLLVSLVLFSILQS